MSEKQLDRLESALIELTKAVTSISVGQARQEERYTSSEKDKKSTEKRLEKIDVRLTSIEKKADKNAWYIELAKGVGWLFLAAIIGKYKGWL